MKNNIETTLYMTVGLPASGKSSLYESEYSDCYYVSSDKIRKEYFGNEEDQTNNTEVFRIFREETILALKKGYKVYCDATNLSAKRRRAFLKNIDSQFSNVKKVCLLLVIPIEECIENDQKRERHVTAEIITKMCKNFEVPSRFEGWDDIEVYGHRTGNKSKLGCILYKLATEPHDNPHHTLTIGTHMLKAYEYAVANEFPYAVQRAALYHDIGKGFCKSFISPQGEKTEYAHYWNHANVSAYIYMTYANCEDIDTDLYIANLIQNHMIFFNGDAVLHNLRKRTDEKFIKYLTLLHEADLAAH